MPSLHCSIVGLTTFVTVGKMFLLEGEGWGGGGALKRFNTSAKRFDLNNLYSAKLM